MSDEIRAQLSLMRGGAEFKAHRVTPIPVLDTALQRLMQPDNVDAEAVSYEAKLMASGLTRVERTRIVTDEEDWGTMPLTSVGFDSVGSGNIRPVIYIDEAAAQFISDINPEVVAGDVRRSLKFMRISLSQPEKSALDAYKIALQSEQDYLRNHGGTNFGTEGYMYSALTAPDVIMYHAYLGLRPVAYYTAALDLASYTAAVEKQEVPLGGEALRSYYRQARLDYHTKQAAYDVMNEEAKARGGEANFRDTLLEEAIRTRTVSEALAHREEEKANNSDLAKFERARESARVSRAFLKAQGLIPSRS